ncbi:SMC-Scp complex subunit ScpB [Ottowia sp.]|uniref:SMC-Scp complex subunit ScpB n=1 Tax=Ottowia sp. TaxID=1898956 RepID=UPI0025D2787A|nr:SMC-Scp complex subunit ScpB [Ottowia sp.]MBK6616278.1 SMC-Scp complex subunit ScpB [Ottowia sp.]
MAQKLLNAQQAIGPFEMPPPPVELGLAPSPDASLEPPPILTTLRAQHVVEAALVVAQEPLSLGDMALLFDQAVGFDTLRTILNDLVVRYSDKGVELVCLAEGWRLQCRPEMADKIARGKPQKAVRYSSSAMETLAVIAYRQPVTRADIEEVRGVGVSAQVLQQFIERDWIEIIGHREAPGRPALYATTRNFLEDIGLESLSDLPIPEAIKTRDDELGCSEGAITQSDSNDAQLQIDFDGSGATPPATPGV